MRIALIAKPRDESVIAELRAAVTTLRNAGHRVMPRLTFESFDAQRYARRAARAGVDLIIAAGGDGTVNEVVNGIFASGRATLPRLAVVPTGTANDFARGLNLPDAIAEAMQVAVHGDAAEIDVASVNGRCFVNVSTGGFGPDITKQSSTRAKRRFGRVAYLWTALGKLAQIEPCHARFELHGRGLYDGPFFFYAVGNARQTGGGTPVTPRADYSDDRLDLVIVTGHKRRDFLTLLPDLRAGRHTDDDDVVYVRTGQLVVHARTPFTVNADGEPIPGGEWTYGMMDRTLTVMRGRIGEN